MGPMGRRTVNARNFAEKPLEGIRLVLVTVKAKRRRARARTNLKFSYMKLGLTLYSIDTIAIRSL